MRAVRQDAKDQSEFCHNSDQASDTHLELPQERGQIPSLHEFHYHIDMLQVVERAPERDDEWTLSGLLQRGEDAGLSNNIVHLFSSDDSGFVNSFDRKISSSIVCGAH